MKVITAERLCFPMIKSPSRCPGSRRSATAAGLSAMLRIGLGIPRDLLTRPRVLRLRHPLGSFRQQAFRQAASTGVVIASPVDRLSAYPPVA